ncbi:LacI family DNA-binding transcriptional regulator [Brachybacterium sp. YJGR34]|uniref:LacI family DNA-binding transcriptional regulator n=1 Tax=Brachybacterium sp. YJGR34 TaxID=2059911 RepID=UPI000E0C8B85|nr:LacI family DNA-binding transcriptional regulator [Brachybacterium sp. YJGR34]
MARKSTRPTVATIARDLGISPATVSYALNGKPGVSAALRERVVEHARVVGWTPHSGAQALRRGRSGNIGLVLVRDPQEISREPFYAAVTAGIESAVSAQGYELLLRFVQGGADEEVEVFRTWARQRRVDGVVLLDLTVDDPRPAVLESLGVTFGMLGHYTGPEHFVTLMTAEEEDARTVVEHLVEHGFDGCVQLTGPVRYSHEIRRQSLLAALCAEHGIPHSAAAGEYSIDGGRAALAQVDRGISARPAVVASSDLLALGALREALERGLLIPRDLGLISWDDSLIAEVATPSITALAREPFAMGRSAGDLLVRLIEDRLDGRLARHNAPATLVPRASSAAR